MLMKYIVLQVQWCAGANLYLFLKVMESLCNSSLLTSLWQTEPSLQGGEGKKVTPGNWERLQIRVFPLRVWQNFISTSLPIYF